ncbi:MAG TPA: hypothetical protein VFQ13_10105 [Anaerolineales bacterium]|nr:hypothetical protein [Anaerolineales bacterium]
MSSSNSHPKWWQVYLTFPLLIALFVLDARLKISTRGHQSVQIGIILLVYGLIHLWLKANSSALARMDHDRVRVMRVPVSQLPEVERRPMFELSPSEIKGVLSDTFEMDYIDAEAFPVDEVSEKINKE